MFGKYFSKLVSVLMARIFSEELDTLTNTHVKYMHFIKQHESKKHSMTDKNNVISDIGRKYNVGKKVARHLEAISAIIYSQII